MASTLQMAPVGSDVPARQTLVFLDLVFPPPRTFDIRLWNGETVAGESGSDFTIILTDPGALRRMFRPPLELALGEAYLRGDMDVEGDLYAAYAAIDRAVHRAAGGAHLSEIVRAWLRLPRTRSGAGSRLRAPTRPGRGSPEDDRRGIRYHYDVGNDFYSLWLDRRMCYSCAYFPDGTEDLDAAQEKKLELICRKLRLQPGERLLDIGCGWGGLLIHAARQYGAITTGITLSQAQYDHVAALIREEGLSDRVRVELRDYRDLGGEPFDKIASIGMYEHVGRENLDAYFRAAHRMLRPGGLFLNHGICRWPPAPDRRTLLQGAVDRWVLGRRLLTLRYFFPNGETLPLSDVNAVAERCGFEVRDVENLREHYALTLRHWVARLESRREEVEAVAGSEVFRLWHVYFAASAVGFEQGRNGLHQTLLARPEEDGRVGIPMSRRDIYF